MLAGNGGSLVFSIMLGTNDSAESGTNGAPVSPESYATNLRSLITGLQQEFPDAYFVLHEPLWYSPNTANGAEYGTRGLARLQSYFAQLPLVAASFPNHVYLGDTQAYGLLEAHAKDDLTPEQGRRGIFYLHPNPQGARLLGHQWAKALLATLK